MSDPDEIDKLIQLDLTALTEAQFRAILRRIWDVVGRQRSEAYLLLIAKILKEIWVKL